MIFAKNEESSIFLRGAAFVFLYMVFAFFDKNFHIFVVFRGWGASNMQNSFTKTRTKRSENDQQNENEHSGKPICANGFEAQKHDLHRLLYVLEP